MRVNAESHRRGGVTLVAVRATNDGDAPRRVRLANECSGPVWPPREGDLPAPGWDDGGWEGVLEPGASRALGYATPGSPADPPVSVAWTERAGDSERSATDAVTEFGDPRPPEDAVGPPDDGLPDDVRDWLGDVAERASDGDADAADRDAVAALAARASVLRERVEE
jgi:hypothetical protein